MREIVLDTETTGLSHAMGHRLVEIGCVELVKSIPTGLTFQRYINPERDMPLEAFQVHGLSQEFLSSFPSFHHICSEFLDFIQDSPLVIHNAKFDMGFLNAELARLQRTELSNPVIDTVLLSRKKYPGSPANLDALCKRFSIDRSHRELHGALLDAHLLVKIYQSLQEKTILQWASASTTALPRKRLYRPARSFPLRAEEQCSYELLIQSLNKN